ncbi:Uncharacterised protein [Mycobacteroides abscessus subsp. abscessus]|nr:Uncharacterised protein [Mycobacteroides abscessus subsp. abscessus]
MGSGLLPGRLRTGKLTKGPRRHDAGALSSEVLDALDDGSGGQRATSAHGDQSR